MNPLAGRPMLEQGAFVALTVAALALPFSVAATNTALALALILGLIGGALHQGLARLWSEHRRITLALACYLGWLALSLGWSDDRGWGLHVLGRHWFWLLLPMTLILLREKRLRKLWLAALSLSLAANLGFCVLQKFGIVSVTTGGSTAADATGHIGHIGFGFVYGIWAAWLLHWGWLNHGWRRHGAWALTAWAWLMVFLAQGRSGYLVTIALALIVILMHGLQPGRRRRLAAFAAFALVGVVALGLGQARDRLLGTWAFVAQSERMAGAGEQAAALDAAYRWDMWRAAWEIWKEHPMLGVGLGGFPQATAEVKKRMPELNFGGSERAAHPHQMFLLAAARTGAIGLVLLLWLLGAWIACGRGIDWLRDGLLPLAPLGGLALAVHGLTSASMEEHFTTKLAVLLLAVALAERATKSGQAGNSPAHSRTAPVLPA